MNGNTIENIEYSSTSLTGTGVLYPIYNSGAATSAIANNNTVKTLNVMAQRVLQLLVFISQREQTKPLKII
jgi:lipoprotein signal peptidase